MSSLRTMDFVQPGIPRIPVGDWIDTGFDWVKGNFRDFFRSIADLIETSVETLADALSAPPALVVVAVLALLAWLAKDWKLALGSAIGLAAVVGMDQWDNAMLTLSLVLIATVIALIIGIPLGIAAARWDRFSGFIRPVMDLMQTMPGFVWLVPVVTLFGIAVPAGMIATVIFCLPPAVRLTELGIRQVDAEVVEAGHAFGGTPRQILRGIQMPLAMPTVMAGVNQVIMLALSMAVIAGLVGAPGLGAEVIKAISTLNIGLGFEAGLSVVALAIYLDRVTASVGGGALGRLRRRKPGKGAEAAEEVEMELETSRGRSSSTMKAG